MNAETEMSAEEMVKKTIKLFNEYVEEIKTSNEVESIKKPDLKAIKRMKKENKIINADKRIGSIPGINVGDEFNSRSEMVVVGLHGEWLKGIDYMSKSGYDNDLEITFPIAVSVVMSGRYEDDKDDLEEIEYTGQGGNKGVSGTGEDCDQVMRGGNMALKQNCEQDKPVRVIRKHDKVYRYDGLYNVTDVHEEKGASGFLVFKYKLNSQVHFIGTSRALQGSCHKVCDDISGGQEPIPVPAFNSIDNPPVPPTGYNYCNSVILAEGLTFPQSDNIGCSCSGGCFKRRECSCEKLNGGEFPYLKYKDGGRLAMPKSVVFECGPSCRCGPKCLNKTSQQGLRYNLEVFRTADKGWAVRSYDSIPMGAPVCEYTGILCRTSDLDSARGNDYHFSIDCLETMEGLDGREPRLGVVTLPEDCQVDASNEEKKDKYPEYTIDAGEYGGVARFINHSCAPNLFVQCVVTSQHELKRARIMLFASDDIPPYQELTYDYGYRIDSVVDEDGKVRAMPCHCGATKCRKRLF
ncbi:[histone H3]-lysine(4) N-trimethyltransferase [Ranunculus cassubicifolius]